ncbi:MAG: hypothetical protein COV47_05560 [Candidatus Diapherotrites archaeon CG11_big_fil_rev_8_21_14_0_20_37_9]|nr:MAG: hypothetical protein COV47_05560 [Candidatus Diapherotrites archaeon CG11_big_fil_rev_8_21_14_0_20_37_9]
MRSKLFLIFLIFFASVAFANVAVVIQPVNDSAGAVYPFELKEYELVLVNVSTVEQSIFEVVISVPQEMAIVVNGADKKEIVFTERDIQPSEQRSRVFTVKSLEYASKPLEITTSFGTAPNNNSVKTFVSVVPSTVNFDARLDKTSLGPNQNGNVLFDLQNLSESKLENIKAVLMGGEYVDVTSEPFELASLEVGQKISNTAFPFSLGSKTGDRLLVLRLFFDDSEGTHMLEKSFSLDVQNRDIYVAMLIGLIVFLVGFSIYFRRKKERLPVDAEGLKIEVIESKK